MKTENSKKTFIKNSQTAVINGQETDISGVRRIELRNPGRDNCALGLFRNGNTDPEGTWYPGVSGDPEDMFLPGPVVSLTNEFGEERRVQIRDQYVSRIYLETRTDAGKVLVIVYEGEDGESVREEFLDQDHPRLIMHGEYAPGEGAVATWASLMTESDVPEKIDRQSFDLGGNLFVSGARDEEVTDPDDLEGRCYDEKDLVSIMAIRNPGHDDPGLLYMADGATGSETCWSTDVSELDLGRLGWKDWICVQTRGLDSQILIRANAIRDVRFNEKLNHLEISVVSDGGKKLVEPVVEPDDGGTFRVRLYGGTSNLTLEGLEKLIRKVIKLEKLKSAANKLIKELEEL